MVWHVHTRLSLFVPQRGPLRRQPLESGSRAGGGLRSGPLTIVSDAVRLRAVLRRAAPRDHLAELQGRGLVLRRRAGCALRGLLLQPEMDRLLAVASIA